jgi:DNA-binding transcriptional ArsR family regulator
LGETRHVSRVVDIVKQDLARINILHTLTGGNPRMLMLLFGVLSQGLNGDVRSDLEGLLDLVTPLYKARFEALPDSSQKIVDALALHWDPITAKGLAENLGMPVNNVSSLLSRLETAAVVEKVAPVSGKRAAFQISERFFNIWYLMRASRRVRKKLVWLVYFLKMFFSAQALAKQGRTQFKSKENLNQDDTASLNNMSTVRQYQINEAKPVVITYQQSDSAEDNIAETLAIAKSLIQANQWEFASDQITRVIRLCGESLPEQLWSTWIELFRLAVKNDKAPQLLAIIDGSQAALYWRPLREALASIVADSIEMLNGVAPEVKAPALILVEQLTSNVSIN